MPYLDSSNNNTNNTHPSATTPRFTPSASQLISSSLAAIAPISVGDLYPEIIAAVAQKEQHPELSKTATAGSHNSYHGPMAYFTTHHFSPQWTEHSKDNAAGAGGVPAERTSTSSSSQHRRLSYDGLHPKAGLFTHYPNYQPVGRLAHMIDGLHFHLNSSKKGKSAAGPAVAYPRFDLAESPTSFTIYGELPGIGPDAGEMSVAVDDSLSTVSVAGLLVRGIPQNIDLGSVSVAHQGKPKAEEEKEEDKAEEQPTEAPPEEAKPETGEAAEPAAAAAPAEETVKEVTQEEAPVASAPAAEPPVLAGEDPLLTWHTAERQVGQFQRVFHFAADEVDLARVHAGLRYGLLTIVVPKRAESPPKARGRDSFAAEQSGRKIKVANGSPKEEDFSLAHVF